MNVVFAFAIASVIYWVGLPVLVNPSKIGYVEPGSPEAATGDSGRGQDRRRQRQAGQVVGGGL